MEKGIKIDGETYYKVPELLKILKSKGLFGTYHTLRYHIKKGNIDINLFKNNKPYHHKMISEKNIEKLIAQKYGIDEV